MAKVVPTILSQTPADFAARIDKVKSFVQRVHLDFSDGVFTPVATLGLAQMYGVDGIDLDLHMMVTDPVVHFENTLALQPSLVIIHAEASCDHSQLIHRYKEVGIRAGLAILQDTKVEQVEKLLPEIDYLLVFCGTLGYNHGQFDAAVLDKIQAAKAINPNLEVAVDGGIDQSSARQAVEAGADVLNSGSFIQDAPDPEAAYLGLEAIASGETA